MRLLYVFFIGSIFGWGLETVFRRFCKSNTSRKWINPGFLLGPYLPLYGFGACTLYLLAEVEHSFDSDSPFSKFLILLTMAVCMTLLELIAGLIFVCGMKVELWNYSDKPFNFRGIICLEFSFYWFLLATFYYIVIHPPIVRITDFLSENMFCLFPLGVLTGIFAVDVGYSVQIVTKIKKFAAENNILVRYEELKSNIRKYAEEHEDKYSFLFSFKSKVSLIEHLESYLEAHPKLKKIKSIKSIIREKNAQNNNK